MQLLTNFLTFQQFDMLELDRFAKPLVSCPLLLDTASYLPDVDDLTQDAEAREYWLQCFEEATEKVIVFFLHNFCVKPYVPREPRRDPSNRRLNEHGIYIRHCQELNSQPVPSQAGADTTRPQ